MKMRKFATQAQRVRARDNQERSQYLKEKYLLRSTVYTFNGFDGISESETLCTLKEDGDFLKIYPFAVEPKGIVFHEPFFVEKEFEEVDYQLHVR